MSTVKRCDQCQFSSLERPTANVLQTLRFCRRHPPTPVPLPGARGSIQVTPVFPAVADDQWCHAFEVLPPLSN